MRPHDSSFTPSARVSLGVCLALVASLVLLPGGGRLLMPPASAGAKTPIDPNELLPSQSPSPSPSPTPSPTERPEKDDDGDEESARSKGNGARSKDSADGAVKEKARSSRRARMKAKRRRARAEQNAFVYPSVSYSSSRLVATAIALRGLGAAPSAAMRAYVPFVVEGQSSWADTWGAPRFGPGDRVREHEGQDVFCHEGASVLAIDAGRIEFDTTTLGGLVARLHTADGRYFYYAHLSGWNSTDFSSGDSVARGDEIGYCGDSGNAEGTSPHVHFGWYDASGKAARNPHARLVESLLAAERDSAEKLRRMQHRVSRNAPAFRTRRLFGYGIVPELSEMAGCSRVQARNMLASRIMFGPLGHLLALGARHSQDEAST